MIGQTISHYRVLDKIGAGGMGVVYRAHDERLDRDVALKVLPMGSLASRIARTGFRKEAIALAKLNHPNIAAIYEFDAKDEVDFLVMEIISGVTLSTKMSEGPLPTPDLVAFGVQITAAVEEAHACGVIHRDLKPGNIMVTSKGQVKVLDFGLARFFRTSASAATESVTEMYHAAGTLAYMAPEILKGKPADPRSDIWSVGVVLYEMTTGTLPFIANNQFELSSLILREEPLKISDAVPSLLREVIARCLEKEPQRRFQCISDVRLRLQSIYSGTLQAYPLKAPVKAPAFQKRQKVIIAVAVLGIVLLGLALTSIPRRGRAWLHSVPVPQGRDLAVLPFSTPNDDPQTTAFEYGLAETLATRLTKLSGIHPLQVIPASEVRAKGVTTLEQARQEFGVNLGLELNLRRSGNMIRVNYSLVDARTHRQLKGDTITAASSDTFAIEDKVADSVVKSLDLNLQPTEQQSLLEHGTDKPAAYDYYLQGRGYLQEFQKRENVESAITVFNRALELDPGYALAFAGLGESYWHRFDLEKQNLWAEQARHACEKAVSLAQNQAEGHTCLGMVYNGTGKYEEAISQFKRSVNLEPNDDDAIRGLASAYASLGRMEEAETTYKLAITARPDYWRGYNSLGSLYFDEGHYAQAAEMFSRVVALAPDSFRGYSNFGGALVLLGRYADAVEALQHSIEIRPTADAYSNLATAYYHLRRFEDAAFNYSRACELDERDYVLWGNLADAFYYSGRRRAESASAYQKAISLAKLKLEINPRDASVLGDIANYDSMLGNREESAALLEKALAQTQYKDPDLLFIAAMVHNQFGDKKATLEWLAKALAAGYSNSTVADAPALDNLHSDREFQSLLKNSRSE